MVALDRRIPHLFDSEYVIIGQSDTNLTYRYRLPCMDRNRGSGNSAGRNILFPRAGHFLEDVFHIDTHSIDCRFESIIMNRRNFFKKSIFSLTSLAAISLLERLSFPWLSYNDYSMTAPKQMPVVLIETMNGTPERNNSNGFGSMEFCISRALGQPQHIAAYNTCQVNDYSRYELGGFSEEAKHQWREAHWEEDLQKAFDAGRQMAEM